jgi:hypothetical protein
METGAPDIVETSGPVAELQRLGDEIAVLAAHLGAATARLLDLIRDFDARGGWNNGFRSCAQWLNWRVGLDMIAAREHVRVARALGSLPRLGEALARGELSYSKVRALTRVATPETEERLLAVAKAATASQLERIICAWRRADRLAELRDEQRRHDSRALHVYQNEDGTVVFRGRLTAEAGAVLMKALEAAREALYRGARAARSFENTAPVLADADAPGQSLLEETGTRVSAETSQRLACDAARVLMRHEPDGQITEVGARTRTIPPAIRRALHHRDRGCRFPGCGLSFTQAHHVRHWAQGGPTTLSNLASLCRRHHRAVHEEGYQVERLPNGTLEFRKPDGAVLPDVPTPPAIPRDPVHALRARHELAGLRLHARTGCPGWQGERLDVGYAIDVLHPRALRSRP